jgi:hypothetical protein
MLKFGIPVGRDAEASGVPRSQPQRTAVLLAGSRSRGLPEALCRGIVRRLAVEGFGYLVGCAPGVDRSFRLALAREGLARSSVVACASRERLSRSCGLPVAMVAPEWLSMAAALHWRTVWMVTRCRMVVLFPEGQDGSWGPGSRLVLRTALEQGKPVFVASATEPRAPASAVVRPGSMYGLVSGWWVVPRAIHAAALCDVGA